MAARLIADHPTYATQGIFHFSLNFFWSIRLNIPGVITLPDESYMEGLAIDGIATMYTSNFATGEINLTNYKLNTNSVFAPADEKQHDRVEAGNRPNQSHLVCPEKQPGC